MKNKVSVYQKIKQEKMVAVIRTNSKDDAQKIIDASIEGGINLIEVTMTTPDAIELIKEVKKKYKETVCIGAGSVLDVQTAQRVILAGSEFVVSPYLNEEVIKLCNLYQVMGIPGTTNMKDMIQALKLGCDIIKLFPANLLGVGAIKSFKGPLPQVELMPTGGVNLENAVEWLKGGAIAVGVGNDLSKKALETRDFSFVTHYSEQLVSKISKLED